MISPRLTTAGLALLAHTLVFAAACGGKGSGGAGGTGGTAGGGSGGATGSGGAASSGGTTGTGGMTVDAGAAGTGGGPGGSGSGGSCPLTPPSVQGAGVTLKFPMDLVYEGRPFVFGEVNEITSTRSVLPLNVRFFVSEAELLTSAGGSIPVDILTESGAIAPYGVFLFHADAEDAQTLHVRAPAGSYAGLKFSVGLTPACNKTTASGKVFPLSEDSQMTWSLGLGHLFLLYASQINQVTATGTTPDGGTADAAPPPLPAQIHMGGDLRDLSVPSALVVRIPGAVTVAADGTSARRIQVAMDQIFKAATSNVDLSDYPLQMPETLNGERLRRTGNTLPLFVFAP